MAYTKFLYFQMPARYLAAQDATSLSLSLRAEKSDCVLGNIAWCVFKHLYTIMVE